MITITIQLHTILQRHAPGDTTGEFDVQLAQASTIRDLIQHLGIAMNPDAMLIVVNGRIADENRTLQDGDHVNLMPAISGGSAGIDWEQRKDGL